MISLEQFRTQRPSGKGQLKAWEHFLEVGPSLLAGASYRFFRLRELFSEPLTQTSKWRPSDEKIASECGPTTLLFINGEFQEQSTSLKDIVILPLAIAERSFGSFLTKHTDEMLKKEKNPFALLNAAYGQKGVFVYVPPHVQLQEPLEIVHFVHGDADNLSFFSPRVHICMGEQSSLTLISRQISSGNTYFFNPVIEFTLEEKATAHCVTLIDEQEKRWHTSSIRAHLKQASLFKAVTITNGTDVMLQDVRAILDGKDAHASFSAGWTLAGKRQAQFHVSMEHKEPHTSSSQNLKGILKDKSRSNFQGKIHIVQDAQKVEAFQSNKHLLLSDEAIATSNPMLEIFADDVKASHGSTIGQISKDDLFYLKSRGMDEETARHLLLQGFLQEIIDQIAHAETVKRARQFIGCLS